MMDQALFSSPANSGNINQLAIISQISQSIISTLDTQKVLQIISDGMAKLLEIESTAIYLVDKDNSLTLSAATPPLPEDMPDFAKKLTLQDHPHIVLALESKKTIYLADPDREKLTPAEKDIVEKRNLKSLIYIPFILNNEALGILILSTCSSTKVFSEQELSLAQTVANQLAVAIQNTQMHNRLEILVKEKTEDLDTAIEELRAANEELSSKNDMISSKNLELKKTLRNLKETQAQLIESEKMASIGTLTSGLAHEINNPLNFIQGGYYAIEQYSADFGSQDLSKTELILKSIKTGVDRASEIITILNQFNQDSKSIDEECDLHSIIDNCLLIKKRQIAEKKAVIAKEYCGKALTVFCITGQMHHIFLSLIDNALFAIAEGGKINIRSAMEAGTASIVIEDNGSGIPENIIGNISDAFFTTKEPGQGTGLGLHICSKIIRAHKGTINFSSIEGQGTAVSIHLPLSGKA